MYFIFVVLFETLSVNKQRILSNLKTKRNNIRATLPVQRKAKEILLAVHCS